MSTFADTLNNAGISTEEASEYIGIKGGHKEFKESVCARKKCTGVQVEMTWAGRGLGTNIQEYAYDVKQAFTFVQMFVCHFIQFK